MNALAIRVHFVLICEGPSDDGLVPHLQRLCIDAGADEVIGNAPDFRRLHPPIGHSVADKIRMTIRYEPQANLIFIHRDADSRDPEPRHEEIRRAVDNCQLLAVWVPMVPVQETEAWLLLDEGAIRSVAGKPRGRGELRLPSPRSVEALARPKEHLQRALVAASELSGRRLDRFRNDFPSQRRRLLLRLPVGEPLSSVPSWQRLRAAVAAAIARLED